MFTTNLLLGLALSASIAGGSPLQNTKINSPESSPDAIADAIETVIPVVPFYSQFSDIESAKWQKVGCGIASLAMLIEMYNPGVVSVNALLEQGIAADAYLEDDGWTHKGLVLLAQKYNLEGARFDFSASSTKDAFAELKNALIEGPVIASVHYGFDPKSTIPHLVVINGIASTTIYYNDPAEKTGNSKISVEKFLKAWKKRYITVSPPEEAVPEKSADAKLTITK